MNFFPGAVFLLCSEFFYCIIDNVAFDRNVDETSEAVIIHACITCTMKGFQNKLLSKQIPIVIRQYPKQ